jgi:hypothetical protein
MILLWLLETYDLNGESNGSQLQVLLYSWNGFESGSNCLRAKKEDLIRAVQIIKQRYQSITQGKVMKGAED